MVRLIKTEFIKMKRYHILWAGVALMLLTVVLTLFTTLAKDGTVWTYRFFSEQVIKNNMLMIFPMCITLITGYIINCEIKNNTLKSLLTVPVSFRAVLTAKLVIAGVFSAVLGAVCAVFTVVGCFAAGIPGFTIGEGLLSLYQQIIVNLFLYISVLPIIIATSRSRNGFLGGVAAAFVYGYAGLFAAGSKSFSQIYPITASLGMAGYRSYEAYWNFPVCCATMAAVLAVSAGMILCMKFREVQEPGKKGLKTPVKKGW